MVDGPTTGDGSMRTGAAAPLLDAHGGDRSAIVALDTLRAFSSYLALFALAHPDRTAGT